MTRRSTFAFKLTLLATSLALLLAACGGSGDKPPTGREMPDQGRVHVATGSVIAFPNYPPSSGPHYETWLPWRFFDTEQAEGFWIHNLEHGGLVILYNCMGQPCDQLKTQLDGLYNKAKLDKYSAQKIVITANSKIKTRLAVIAWGWVDEFDQFDEARILAFYDARNNKGPEDRP